MTDDVQPPSDSARSFSSEATAAEGTSGGAQQLTELERGEAVGRYLVLGKIGAGGMGVVYAAYDPELDRKVAIKLMHSVAKNEGESKSGQTRLLREAQALARLQHPNVVAVYDAGTFRDRIYVAMEFVEGRTLMAWLAAERRDWQQIIAVFERAAAGLAAAHDAGLVHRDFKPDNVMLSEDGRVRVMDFGLARVESADKSAGDLAEVVPTRVSPSLHSTRVGEVIGTPAYMSPEQWAGSPVDARADQFAFCVALWTSVFGERPFVGDSMMQLGTAVLEGRIREPSTASTIPRWIRPALVRGLAVMPEDRWPSIRALLEALERGQGRARRGRWLRVIAAATVVVVGALTVREVSRRRDVAHCHEVGDAIATSWPGRSEQVRQGMNATGHEYAATGYEKLVPWLARWSTQWSEARTQACLAAEIDGTLSPELHERARGCLQAQRASLDSLIRLLVGGEEGAARNAITAAAALPRVDECVLRTHLERGAWPTTEQWPQVTVLREQLADAEALESIGRYADAERTAASAVEAAVALRWPPLDAEARYRLGTIQHSAGKLDLAEAELKRAYFLAAGVGADAVAVHAAIGLAWALGDDRSQHDLGLEWGRHARMLLDRGEIENVQAELDLLHTLAAIHYGKGEYAAAEALGREEVALNESAIGVDHPSIAPALTTLSAFMAAQGNVAEAEAMCERALDLYGRMFGENHPGLAPVLNNLAWMRQARGATGEAVELGRRALTIVEAAFGAEHAEVAGALSNLASLHEGRGEFQEARRLLERSLAIHDAATEERPLLHAGALHNLAVVLVELGEYEQAEPLLRRAVDLREQILGPTHPDLAIVLIALGHVELAGGDHERAQADLTRSLSIAEAGFGRAHPIVAHVLIGLGDIALARGEADKSVELFRRAAEIRQQTEQPAEPIAEAQLKLAIAMWERPADRAAARELAEDAAATCRGAGVSERLAEIEAWLGAHPLP